MQYDGKTDLLILAVNTSIPHISPHADVYILTSVFQSIIFMLKFLRFLLDFVNMHAVPLLQAQNPGDATAGLTQAVKSSIRTVSFFVSETLSLYIAAECQSRHYSMFVRTVRRFCGLVLQTTRT